MAINPKLLYDFIIVRPKEGVDKAILKTRLVDDLGIRPENADLLLAQKSAVAIEVGVLGSKIEELKQKWDIAGFVTEAKVQGLQMLVDHAEPEKEMAVCPACGHKQEKLDDLDQCGKCGQFKGKVLEQQRKQKLIEKERERLEKVHGASTAMEEKAAKERREKAELDEIRRKLEEEMGLNKKGKAGIWETLKGSSALVKVMAGVAALGVVVTLGWMGYNRLSTPPGPSPEEVAKQQAVAAKEKEKQGENAMQKAVGQLMLGSKNMAKASGAADKLTKEIFSAGEQDSELSAQMQDVAKGNEESRGTISADGRAEGLAAVAKDIAEVGGSTQNTERALARSMESAKDIKDEDARTAAVSAVAGAQFGHETLDARVKAAKGDWSGASVAFSKAMTAAADITSKSQVAIARAGVAKSRAETGDFGGAALLFVDAIKIAEEITDPRDRALTLAEIAKNIAESSNDLGGAAERAFGKAIGVAKQLTVEADKTAVLNGILSKRIETAVSIASYLLSTNSASEPLKALFAQATQDAEQITGPALRTKGLVAIARVAAESGDAAAAEGLLGSIAALAETFPEASVNKELILLSGKRAKAETLAAGAKYSALKGDKAAAKKGFLQALQAANTIVAVIADPQVKSDAGKQRGEALSTIGRYMHAAGDSQAAARLFNLAIDTAAAK